MKPEELRIGNLVLDDENKICVVHCVEHNDYSVWNDNNDLVNIVCKPIDSKDNYFGIVINGFNPIELNEEWFIKFGAKHSDTVTTSKNYYLIIGNAFLVFNKDSTLFNGQPINHIKYVHQLQNLYFSLTGKELQINE